MKAKVYFSKTISPEEVVRLFEMIDSPLCGNVAVKVHSGEVGNQNFLKPTFWKPIVEKVNGTVVECNTAYDGGRDTSEKHLQTLKDHGWTKYFNVDLLDEEGPDLELDIKEGKRMHQRTNKCNK